MTEIEFFSSTKTEYRSFSNFFPSAFQLKGKSWPTVEHYYQAQKFVDPKFQDDIRQAATPYGAKRMGQTRKASKLRSDWEEVKEEVMREALKAKFSTHPRLADLLVRTQDAVLVEASPFDSYWGKGRSGTGQNRLGELLMELRVELQTKE